MELTYPTREKFFAHKFVRLLHKAAVASEIGRDAFALLTVIVHTEDAMRYRGAAKFWNSQLTETLGFKKWDQFDACRKRAIEAGWLIYVCHGKRMAGEYWVTIPDGYEMVTDAPIESYPENGYDTGYKAGYDAGYKQGMKAGTIEGRTGVRTGDEQGEPSIPVPIPDSNPKPCPKNIYTPGPDVTIPEHLKTPQMITAVGSWLQHLECLDTAFGTHKTIQPNSPQEQALWATLMSWGCEPAEIAAAINAAIAGQWQNLRKPEPPRQQNGNRKPANGGIAEIERIARELDERDRLQAEAKAARQAKTG